ncbi:hypothetical protein A3B56_02920 [Candidatus Roizmanbacteria bacterium RIFCSPLOWO2_01_FULL_45_11]|uniref:Bacterial Ig domain-containing protein n=1 Tax=Candidatus Roizmanbacteria bacterium RIFCSPLOWO2_01_FULL_45_11 TaxID=1802070 RepID=A0A1F7JE65_9BACT|nr:MAG: hypothetical protein A3B56_02920 [Candidatus Roizmanbacteria bacterium RIFCSPLOWO2_01_FULL_45_11]
MIKKVIWVILLGGILVYALPKLFFQLSLLFDPSSRDIRRVVGTDESTLILAPRFDTMPDATNSATLAVHGFAQNTAEVELYINDIPKDKISVSSADGKFTIPRVRLYEGENGLKLLGYDRQGSKSAFSDVITIMYKKNGPKLIVEEPSDNTDVNGSTASVKVVGLTDSDSEVTINGRWVRVSSDGTFTQMVQLKEGDNTLEIVARDEAGNESRITRPVRYTKE